MSTILQFRTIPNFLATFSIYRAGDCLILKIDTSVAMKTKLLLTNDWQGGCKAAPATLHPLKSRTSGFGMNAVPFLPRALNFRKIIVGDFALQQDRTSFAILSKKGAMSTCGAHPLLE
ncbi:MAG: hypothetical protein KDC44_09365 [Phaeodactylibacter sp.]|nr:hypothetical protein [Phaeodactylibacter sp.]